MMMSDRLWRTVILLIFGAVALAAFSAMPRSAKADAQSMISVGGAAELNSETSGPYRGGITVLLRLGYDAVTKLGDDHTYVLAHLRGTIATDKKEGSPAPSASFLDVSFEPIGRVFGNSQDKGELSDDLVFDTFRGLRVSAAPMRFRRDLRLKQDFKMNVSAVRVEAGGVKLGGGNLAFGVFGKLAVEALSAQIINYSDSSDFGGGKFRGVRLGGVSAEVGALMRATENVRLRLSLGGAIDASLGRFEGKGGFGPLLTDQTRERMGQMDLEVFTELRVLIVEAIEIYVRGAFYQSSVGGFGSKHDVDSTNAGYLQGTTGVIVHF
jgi:hypothetical protein